MSGDEARCVCSRIDKPRGADIQESAVGGGECAVDDVASTVRGLLRNRNFIIRRMGQQSFGEMLPIGDAKAMV